MSKNKPVRIWTNKDYENGSSEWIELQDGKYYIWKGEDKSCGHFSFPICFESIAEKFAEQGRSFTPAEDVVDAAVICQSFLDRGEFCTVYV